jgi:anti-anti-sigma factor
LWPKHRQICVNSLFFPCKLTETGSQETASTTTHAHNFITENVIELPDHCATLRGQQQEEGTGMNIEQREVDGVTVAYLSGRLDSSVAGDVMDKLNGIVTAGATRLVINLKDLTYISSSGLRGLLVAAKLIKSSNGDLRLCEPIERVAKVLNDSGFSNLIHTDKTQSDSIAALRAAK